MIVEMPVSSVARVATGQGIAVEGVVAVAADVEAVGVAVEEEEAEAVVAEVLAITVARVAILPVTALKRVYRSATSVATLDI